MLHHNTLAFSNTELNLEEFVYSRPYDSNWGRTALLAGVAFSLALTCPLSAQPGPGPLGPGPGCNPFPTPAGNSANFDLSYFGATPVDNLSLTGPVQLLRSGTVDAANGTITLPLYKGTVKAAPGDLSGAKTVWYILTDASDAVTAAYLGINYSPKLAFAGASARTANVDDSGNLMFDFGTVDFTPVRTVTPGSPAAFPPQTAQPGSVADAAYSPLVRVVNGGGVIYNAPMIAYNVQASDLSFASGNPDYSKVHDQVLKLDPVNMTVTLNLINGFAGGRQVWYLSTEASSTLSAAVEGATYAPSLQMVPSGANAISGATEPLFVAINGASDGACNNPQRQGLTAALTDGHRPGNVLGAIPTTGNDYSPLWDAIPYQWTDDAVSKGYRGQLRERFQVLNLVRDGLLTGPGGMPFGTGDFIVNCPVAVRLN